MWKLKIESYILIIFLLVMLLFAQACEPRGANRDTIENDNDYEMMEGEDIPPAEERVDEDESLDSADLSEMRRLEQDGMKYRKLLDSLAELNPEIAYTYIPSEEGRIKTVLGDYMVEVDNTVTQDEKETIAVLLQKRFENRRNMLNYYNKLNNVDMPPSPQDGYDHFYEKLQSELNYPKEVASLDIEGLLFVQLAVEKDGSISNIEIAENINTPNSDLDEQIADIAINAIRNLNVSWKPAQHDGQPVRSKVEIPIWLDTAAGNS